MGRVLSAYVKLSLLFVLLVVSGCSQQQSKSKPVKIAVSSWVGYMPLVYAYKMGYLKETNIRLVATSSLKTSMEFIKRDVVEGFCATQRGFDIASKHVDLTPLFLFDRSYGGDAILSSIPKEKFFALKNATVTVYLENESVNYTMFEQFQKHYALDGITFHLINTKQQLINPKKLMTPSIIVTYQPYIEKFKKAGFYELDNSTNKIYNIIDALFVKSSTLKDNAQDYKVLTRSIERSIAALQKDPRQFYETVKNYLEGQSYDTFLQSVKDVKFIGENKGRVVRYFESTDISTDGILNEKHTFY